MALPPLDITTEPSASLDNKPAESQDKAIHIFRKHCYTEWKLSHLIWLLALKPRPVKKTGPKSTLC